jgi:hypothetical protein
MRMKNPFASDSGDENGNAGDEPTSDETRMSEEPTGETRTSDEPTSETAQSEQPASETRQSEQPTSETKQSDQPDQESSESDEKSGGSGGLEGQQITAPSIGPHTKLEHIPPEERLDYDKISDTDAMGRDKRREVVGGTYGPTRARVFGTFAAFFAIVAALVVGFYFLAKELDAAPAENPDEAPWSKPEAEQKPPRPIQ